MVQPDNQDLPYCCTVRIQPLVSAWERYFCSISWHDKRRHAGDILFSASNFRWGSESRPRLLARGLSVCPLCLWLRSHYQIPCLWFVGKVWGIKESRSQNKWFYSPGVWRWTHNTHLLTFLQQPFYNLSQSLQRFPRRGDKKQSCSCSDQIRRCSETIRK